MDLVDWTKPQVLATGLDQTAGPGGPEIRTNVLNLDQIAGPQCTRVHSGPFFRGAGNIMTILV